MTSMADYEQYEANCEKQRTANEKLLEAFQTWLKSKGLTDKTIRSHYSNIELYINNFLLYEDVVKPEEGVYSIGMYLGYWFIKKAAWVSKAAIKGNATSLTKFYTFLLEKGLIKSEELVDLKARIKEDMPEWLENIRRFDEYLDSFD
jgi:site-specific recombinase XerD